LPTGLRWGGSAEAESLALLVLASPLKDLGAILGPLATDGHELVAVTSHQSSSENGHDISSADDHSTTGVNRLCPSKAGCLD
ncbi:hypothetical protein, partial [Streptomyces sp. NPDC054863]